MSFLLSFGLICLNSSICGVPNGSILYFKGRIEQDVCYRRSHFQEKTLCSLEFITNHILFTIVYNCRVFWGTDEGKVKIIKTLLHTVTSSRFTSDYHYIACFPILWTLSHNGNNSWSAWQIGIKRGKQWNALYMQVENFNLFLKVNWNWMRRTIFKESYETVTKIYIVKGKEWLLHLFIQMKNKRILYHL